MSEPDNGKKRNWRTACQRILSRSERILDRTKTLIGRHLNTLTALLEQYLPLIRERLSPYIQLTRLDRPIGAYLLLWPTLWALWIASEGFPSLHLFLVFTLGVFLTRSAGCVFNDIADRKFDPHVRRTACRPVASGTIRVPEALGVASALLLLAFLLVLTTNLLTVLLSFVAVLLAVIYPLMKRYTYVPQFFLGLAFSWGIPMAFAAVTGTVPVIAWLLYIANILWAMIYDTIYAMVDREDDIRIGVKSTAILFEEADRLFIGILQLMFLSVLIIIGIRIAAGSLYYSALVPVTGLMLYHQYLIRNREPDACFRAFLNNNWLGITVLGGLCLTYL